MGDFLEVFRKALAEGESGSFSSDPVRADEASDNAKKSPVIESTRSQGKRSFIEVYRDVLNEERNAARLQKQTERERLADEASARKGEENIVNRNEFMRGLLRGIDTTQAAFYGGLGMYSSAMGDDKASDMRFAQYREQMRQASENPATVDQFFSTDPQKGAFGSVGNFGTWVAGTAGSLIPSVAEAGAAGVAGAAIGGAIVPAPDPGDIVTVPAGFIGGVFGRAAIKKAMAEAAQKYVEKGVAKEIADRMGRQAVNNVLAKRVGGLAAAQRITALQEGGGMYAEGREAGYDNPWSAILFGEASGLTEIGFGNMPFAVKNFIGRSPVREAIKNADPRTAAGYIWDAVKNTGEEGIQEGFQEFLGSVNESINDPEKKLLTKENFMQWAEASAAGALAGAGFGAAGAASSALQDRAERLKKLKEKGFISEEDATEAGIEGNSRRERMANVESEINRIEQEIQVQDTPDPEIASMIDGMISEGESDDEFARQQSGAPTPQAPQAEAPVTPTPLYEVAGDQNMVARVWPNPQGFLVNLTDIDSGEVFPTANIFPTFEQAKQHADTVQLPQVTPPAPAQTPVIDPEEAARLDREYAQQMAEQQQPPVIPPPQPQGEIPDASAIRSPQEEVRQEEGGADLRGSGQEQVRTQPESQEPPAQAEVQVGDLPEPKSAEEVESLPKFSLYKTTVQGKDYIAIRGGGRRGGGDELYESFKEASQKAESKRSQEQAAIEAAQKKAEQESAAAEERSKNLPSYRDWRFNSTARNSGKIVPNKVGVKFLPDQMQSISDWAKSQGFSVSNVTPTGIKVLDPSGKRLDISMYGAAGVKDEKAKAAKAQQEADRRKADEERKKKADSRKSASWITETFGGVINDSNRNALSDFLEGDTDKFKGMVSANWRSGLEKIGALSPEGKIDWGKVKSAYASTEQAAKPESTEKPQPASQSTKPLVVKQRLKNAVRFAPDTVIPEGVPFTRGKHPAFGDYIEVFNSHLDRIPGYSKDLPSEGGRTQAKVPSTLSEAESRKAAIRKAIDEQGGFEANSADDVDAIRRKLYNGADTPTGTDIRAVMEEMKIEAGRKAEAEASKPAEQPAAEGKTEAFRALPAKSQAKFEELWNAGGTTITQALDQGNKAYRSEFEARTGVKLPKTVKGTNEAVAKWDSEGRKLAGEAKPAAAGPVAEQPKRSEGVEAALKALDAITATEKPKAEPAPKKGRKEPEKTKQGQYVLPLMPGMAAEIDRQDFVRRYRDRALEPLWAWSNKEEDAEGIQATIDTLAPIYSEIFNDIYAGKRETIDDVYDSEPYERILKLDDDAIAVGDALIINRLDEQIKAALQDYPKKEAKRPPRKSEQTLKEAKSDMQIAHDAAAASMEKIRNKLMSGVDPEISAEVVRVAYLYTKAGVKTFRGYVEAIVENFGDAFAREFSQYMQDGWTALNVRGFVQDPAGRVEDYLAKETKDGEQQGERGTDQDLPMGDGTGEPQGDGTRGDSANDAERDSKKGTGPQGDQVLPTDAETTGVDGRGGGERDGTDGSVDANQPEQGSTEGTDGSGGTTDKQMGGQVAVNHVISNEDDLAVASVTESLKRNIKALQILKKLEVDGRFPDESERKSLAQYTGWGGLSQALDSIKGERMLQGSWNRDENWEKKWGDSYVKLKEILTKEEFQAAQNSTENAHYTSKDVIQSLWKIAERLGYKGGRVLELGAGVGHFAGLTPSRVRGVTQFTMVEMDSISSRIAKMLYPSHDVFSGDMQQFKAVPGSVTIGIGNVPFAGGTVADSNKRYGEPLNLHNYSIARHLDALAPGGVVVVISSHNTLDSNIKQRKLLASKGELIGAIRLPNDAFASNAKTEVVTDILVFRRPRQGDPAIGVRFDQNVDITVKNKDGKDVTKQINRYFAENPEMVLGTHSAKGSMYAADEYTVESTPGDLQDKINAAIEKLPRDILGTVSVAESVVATDVSIPFGRLEMRGKNVVMGYGDSFTPIAGKKFEGFPVDLTGKTGVARAKDFIGLRDALALARETMLSEEASEDDVKSAQKKLGGAYDKYVEKHGNLNDRKTSIFKRDPDYYRVLALENEKGEYDPASKKIVITYSKASIFTERVLGPQREPTSAASPADAMSISLAWKGAIDSAYIGRLLGLDAIEAEEKLIEEGLAFRNPSTTQLEMSDLYLSGNVRSKLEQAKISAEEDPQYQKNVDALEKVLPEPVALKKDTVRLGATWIPENVISAFAAQAFGTEIGVSYNANTDSWTVGTPYGISETAKARYQTERIRPHEILAELLNLRSIKVFDKVETGESDSSGRPKTTQVLNEKETQAAKHRASVMRADFEKWVLENRDVSQVLAKIYNERYNNFVRAKYNGDFLTLPGSNPEVKLRPYQKDAIWRIINRGTALLAHAVGSGKTYTMIGAAMEMRRLGIARRPLLVVQNATLGQFATSFQKMYPNAKVLVATKEDLGKGKRQLFLNKISTGDWDAVVMAQSTLDNMASDENVERAFIQDQIDLLEESIREEGGAHSKTPTVKQLVRQKKSLQDRFDKLMGSRAKKGDNVVFEDLNVDALFLDEAHAYKKPTFATKLSNLVGLNTESSAKSLATMIKVRSVQSANNGRNVILATGTPVTNTLGEAWHMVNYVSPATNAAFNSRTFDQFISNFAMVEPTLTMNAGGQYVYKDAIVKFRNGRQLVEYINDSWDIVTPENLRAYMESNKKGFPVLRNGKLTAITVDRTPGVASFMAFIESVYARYKSLKAKERRELSFIPALAYGASKAATLDIRLVRPNAAEEKNSKLQVAADEITRIYEESMENKGTQLVFSDVKNPYSMDRINQFMGGEAISAFEVDDQMEGDVVAEEAPSDSDSFLYQELKRKLLASGIPSEQIAFISDANTDAKRQALFQRVNNGDVRILIGSTSKMGVGVNVQQKLVAIHHFDTPWLPADLEQREGRILRFGNENEIVEVLRYAMKKTLDGAIYMGTSRKQKFIWQVLNGQLDSDTFDDPSSASMLSIEEQLAAIQDDPVFFEKIEVQNRLRELELERQSFFDAQQRVADSLRNTESDLRYRRDSIIPQLKSRLDRIGEIKKKIEDAGGSLDAFSVRIDGKDYTDPKKADEAVKAKLEDAKKYVAKNFDSLQTVFAAGGLLKLSRNQLVTFTIGPANVAIGLEPMYMQELNDEGKEVTKAVARARSIAYLIEPSGDYIFYEGNATVPATFFEKMGNVPNDVRREIENSEDLVVRYESKISELKTLLGKQWEDEAEYQEKTGRLSEIEAIMLASGGSLSEKKADEKTENEPEGDSDLDNNLRNLPDPLFQTAPDVNENMWSEALNLSVAAQDAGITNLRDFVAYSVKTIGRDRTLQVSRFLRLAAEVAGMDGVQQAAAVSGITRDQVVTMAKRAFGKRLSDEQIEAGITLQDITAFGRNEIGFAPYGTPVPGQAMAQEDFDQPSGYKFNESKYRPAVVSYARDKWGEKIAPNGKPTWQNFVRWFGDSKVVDKDGKPLVVYHGGRRTIDNDIVRTPFFYMTANRSEAEYWAGENGRVHEVYLKFTKPYRDSQHDDRFMDMEERAQDYDWDDPEFAEELREVTREAVSRMNELKGQGYNSIVMQGEADENYDNFIAFDPSQIKSATGNAGTFDPSNPNMLMQRATQTDTPEFKAWFGDSKVVDEDGEPLVVYHGTDKEFDVFDANYSVSPGFWFTSEESGALALGKTRPFYLSVKNPASLKDLAAARREVVSLGIEDRVEFNNAVIEKLEAAGFDGVQDERFKGVGGAGKNVWVALRPTQIKSATGNRGTFDPNNPNILYQKAYHGSPYRFSKFTLDHIGKGEGAQAYGWGLYFADKRQVADYYRETLAKPFVRRWTIGSIPIVRTDKNGDAQYYDDSPRTGKDSDIVNASIIEELLVNQIHIESAFAESGLKAAKQKTKDIVNAQIETWTEEWPEVVKYARQFVKEIDRKFEMEIESPGAIYQVEIPESEDFLLWDKPMKQQSEKVKDFLGRIKPEDLGLRFSARNASGAGVYVASGSRQFGRQVDGPVESIWDLVEEMSGMTFYYGLAQQRGTPEPVSERWASEFLAKNGIRGMKYLDQNSRFSTAGEESFNYVIYDASDIVIQDALFQKQQQGGSVKGWTKFISAHRALIGATNKADFSTFIHEFFHPMRLFLLDKSVPAEKRADITDEEIETLEKYSGVKNGVWTVEAEEKAAKMWEQYWYEGISPNSVLDSLFQKISRWMREIYSGVQEITGTPLPKEIRDLFDKLVQRGLPADQRGGKGGEPVSRGEPVLRPVDPVTSIKNEVANRIALLRGSPGLVEPEAQTMGEWLEEASNRLRQDPTLGDRLVKELDADPTGPDQIDTAVLQMHYRGLNNALYAAQDRLFAAKDRKDNVAAAKALKEVDAITNSLEEIERVNKKIGTLQARSFAARKITLYADFSRAALERQGRVANGGERLSAEQTRQIAELAAELAKVQGDLAKAEQVIADLQRQDGVRQVVDDDLKKAPKTKTKSEPRQKASTAVQSFVKKFSSIFKPKGGSDTLMQTEDERMAEEAENVVMAYVEAGVFSYGELLANLRKEIGGELPVQAQAAFATAWEKIKAQGEIPIPMVNPGDIEGLTRIAREIQMAIIESGIVTADQEDRAEVVLDAVWRSLQEIDPEITERQTMDALSGYGQFTPISGDEMKRLQRDINGQLLQMAKIKDLEADIRPKATGAQRREMSDEERALVRQVNELKRNSKLYTEDRDGLLKTAIGAAMRATTNRIRDLRKAIAEGKPITKTQVDLASKDKDLAEQKRILAEVTKDYREMFPRQGATPEQRLAAALRATDREIERVTEQLRTGDFSPRSRAEPVTSAELKAKQAELESLRAQRDAIKAQQNPKMSPQERAEVAYIANLKNRIADYEDRMAHGYFGAKPKKAPLESDEITKHKRRLEEKKEEFFRLAAEWRLSQLSPKERVFDWARETSFLARAIMTSMDLSAVFRQGGPGTFAHPMLAKEAAKEMRRAIFSQEEEFNIAEQMSKHPLYPLAVQAKLEATASSGRIQNQEEAYMGRWARDGIGKKGTKINKFSKWVLTPVAGSARAYTTYLNGLRFRLFVYFVDTLGANGQVTLDEAKAIANFINVSTGRGDFGSYNKVAANLSTILFAPRYLASRFLYLGLPFYMLQDAKVSGRVKRLIAMEYARHALGVAGFLATAVALGGLLYDDDDEDSPTVELDPRSTDFMKLKIGETRIDPLSGFGQIATFISQVSLGQKKTMEGEIIDIRGEKKKYGQDGTFDVTANFIRKKLAPIPAAGMNIIAGEDVVGNKATVATATTGLFIPLAAREVVETLMARGVPEGPAIAMLNILGMSGGTYGPKTKYKNANAEERKKLIEKDLEAMEWDSKDPGYKDFLTRDELERFKQRREQRKQSLVYSASANPKRKDFQDDTTYAKAVAERDKALKTMVDGKIGPEEARLLLLAYWRRNNKTLYERKGQALVMKDALVERLRQITQKLNQK